MDRGEPEPARPRLAVLSASGAAPEVALRLASEGAGAQLDLVLIAAEPRARAEELGLSAPRACEPERLGATLREAREGEGWVALASVDPLGLAKALLAEARLDGALILGAPPVRSRLRVREAVAVLELAEPPLAEGLEQGARLLEQLGRGRARLVVLQRAQGAAELEAAVATARSAGVDVEGPLGPRAASEARGDAWVTWSEEQSELTLGFLGRGPETGLGLAGRWAWTRGGAAAPLEPSELRRALELLSRLARARAEAGQELAAERDPSAPVVSVAPRPPQPQRGRCPMCHRQLHESPDGRYSAPGPPLLCASCGAAHHRDCLSEHGRCAIMGCESLAFTRLGVTLGAEGLGVEEAREWPFAPLPGDAGEGPQWLRVESPIDALIDGARPPRLRAVTLELERGPYRRGQLLQGNVRVACPKPTRIRGATFAVRATLTTRPLEGKRPPRAQTILARQACFLGEPGSALSRLALNMSNMLGGEKGVLLPAGVRRYPFRFEVPSDHPATLRNRGASEEEEVETRLVVDLGGQHVEQVVEIA